MSTESAMMGLPPPDDPRHTESAMLGSSVTSRHPSPGWNRFPLGHPMNPDPVQRKSRASGSFSSFSSLSCISGGGGVADPARIRIYGPLEVRDSFHRNRKEDDIKRVLAKIEMIYREAELDRDSLESGYCCCLGLLNPKTNILVNGSIFNSNGLLNPKANIGVNDSVFNNNAAWSWSLGSGKGGNMVQRSLDGLITFLTCLFPYLPVAEALAYLDAVDADPLAAAALIIVRRGRNYCWNHYWMDPTIAAATMEMALKCGAVAAQHPDPSLLVEGWMRLSPYLHQISHPQSLPCSGYNLWNFIQHKLRNEYCNLEVQAAWGLADVQAAWGLADVRLHANLKSYDLLKGLPPGRAVMKRVLLAKIHGFYLEALSSLPKGELTERYHRALVMGGYCYGPLQPAANIIVNMIWYEQMFPTTKRLKVTMISTGFLWRVAARSLYGLISFLCTRYPSLTPDHAVQRLLVAEANLQVADPNLFDMPTNPRMDWSWCPQIGSGVDTKQIQISAVRKAFGSVLEAYTAAATAAIHPSPLAQKEFLGSPDSVKKLKQASDMVCLDGDHQLSNEEFGLLVMFLQKCCLSSVGTLDQQEPEPRVVGKSEYDEVSRRALVFWGLHGRVSSMVNAALEKFNRTHESQYSLHIICGVNELVSGPKFCSTFLAHYPFKYQYSHINFMATLDAEPPKLFFAECNLDDPNDSWCVPVDWSLPVGGQARCFYCESNGNRIIHPALSIFRGFDFEEAFFGPDTKYYYENDHIVFHKSASIEWVNVVEEDAIYTNLQL